MNYCENKEFSKEGYHRPGRVITELVKKPMFSFLVFKIASSYYWLRKQERTLITKLFESLHKEKLQCCSRIKINQTKVLMCNLLINFVNLKTNKFQ